jgi:catechol 2,3-dioxygenase-like lactoylglutathione lyase family enzyme
LQPSHDNLIGTVPVVRVSAFAAAEAFYSGRLGFHKEWEYRPHGDGSEPVYAGFARDGARLHVSSFAGDGVDGTVVLFYTRDVDALHREFTQAGIEVDLEPYDQSWGNREMYLHDPDGNRLRFSQPQSRER